MYFRSNQTIKSVEKNFIDHQESVPFHSKSINQLSSNPYHAQQQQLFSNAQQNEQQSVFINPYFLHLSHGILCVVGQK
jgi:hypothetical protein